MCGKTGGLKGTRPRAKGDPCQGLTKGVTKQQKERGKRNSGARPKTWAYKSKNGRKKKKKKKGTKSHKTRMWGQGHKKHYNTKFHHGSGVFFGFPWENKEQEAWVKATTLLSAMGVEQHREKTGKLVGGKAKKE